MGKKCIPGVFCIENMTLFLVMVIGIMVVYLYYRVDRQSIHVSIPSLSQYEVRSQYEVISPSLSHSLSPDGLRDPYFPPEKIDYPVRPLSVRPPQIHPVGIPVNIKTSSANLAYSQVGILTKTDRSGASAGDALILPLMGRNLWNGRDKWQYYTMSNGAGMFSAKLPIKVKGRNCSGEYGCDSITTGDVVYVEGYNDQFRATIYDTAGLEYLPFL